MSEGVEFYKHTLGEKELDNIADTFDNVFLSSGPKVEEFEEKFADILNVEEVVATSSCSDSLFLSLKLFDIGRGDEVITTPMTFMATSNSIIHASATPVFVDINEDTGLIDPKKIEEKITEDTKAIIPVHLYGQMANMQKISEIADKHNLYIIEDSAQAILATRNNISVGQKSDTAVFSFYATKPLTSGNGGAIAIDDKKKAQDLRQLRNHGMTKEASKRYGGDYQHWNMKRIGYKAPMTDIDASILLPQLNRLSEQREKRTQAVEKYEEGFSDLRYVELVKRKGESSNHLFTIQVPKYVRDTMLTELQQRNIGCTVNYRSVHNLDYYRDKFDYSSSDYPVSDEWGKSTISLPLYPDITDEEIELVIESVKEIL